MADNEIAFLQDQVHRLNSELSKYSGKTPIDNAENPLGEDGMPPAQWLIDQGYLSPLMTEYDHYIQLLVDDRDSYKEKLDSVQNQVQTLTDENEKLHERLKKQIDEQLQTIEIDGVQLLGDSDAALQNLQAQVQSALQEKEAAMSRWQEAENEVDRLQKQLQDEKDSHQWKVVEQQAHKMQSEYYNTVESINKELDLANRNLRDLTQDKETLSNQNKELKKSITDLEQQLLWKEQEISDIISKEGMSESRITEMKRIMDSTTEKLTNANKELYEVKHDKETLEVRVKEMQKNIHEFEQKEMDAVTQVRDAVQMVENAVMEKDQLEVELKQKEEEIDKLQSTISSLINEAGIKTRQEVDNVKQQSNERLGKLTEELHRLEMENAEKEEQLKRALREKRQVEAELDKTYKEAMAQAVKDKDSFEDINRRAINAERARDDFEMKLENLQTELKRHNLNYEQLKSQSESQSDQMKERLRAMEQEFEQLNEERVTLQDQVDDMKTQVAAAKKEKEATLRKYQKEITIMENDQKQKFQDYEVRLQSSEDVNRHAISELRKLLNAQQRMSARWKEECESVTLKFELKLKDMRNEAHHMKRRNEELTNLLRESQQKTLEAERMITDYAKNIQRMEERVRESECRASEVSKQLARHTVQQRRADMERRSLLQELNRSNIDSSGFHYSIELEESLVEKSDNIKSKEADEIEVKGDS